MPKKHFTFVVSDEERAMLDKVASASSMLAGAWIRDVIAQAYRRQFGNKPIRRGPRIKRDHVTLSAKN